MIEDKRKVTNKENNPPAIIRTAPTAPPEKPLRKDLLKERFLAKVHQETFNESNFSEHYTLESSSYMVANTSSNDKEFSTINYLMANCDIDYETSMKMSPTKMVGLMRPSTIVEESGLLSCSNDIDESGFDGPIACSGESKVTIEHTEKLSVCTTSEETDTSTYSVKRIFEQVNSPINPNVLREKYMETVNNSMSLIDDANGNNQADDTLEEIEYVLGNGLNYVPKEAKHRNILRQSKNKIPKQENDIEDSENNMKNVNEVITIDSSPETSFITASNAGNFKSAETTAYSFHTAKMDLTGKSKFETLDIDNTASTVRSDVQENYVENSTPTASETTTLCPPSPVKTPSVIKKTYESTNNTSDYSTDKNQSSDTEFNTNAGQMPEFNDSLERMEYMMEQGKKIMEGNTLAAKHLKSPACLKSPAITKSAKSPNPLKTPTGSVKKLNIKATPSPRSAHKDFGAFRKPEIRRPSPSPVNSKHNEMQHGQYATGSKIPKFKFPIGAAAPSSLSKAQFRHIASPIAAYIKNTPEVPLMKTIKPVKNLMESNVYGKPMKDLDISNQSSENLSALAFKPSLPRKACILATKNQVFGIILYK